MLDVLLRLGALLAIFGSVFVISQVVIGSAWRNRSRVRAVNKRLRMIREGVARDEVMARLRKNAPRDFAELPPFFASRLVRLQRTMLAASIPATIGQLAMISGAVFVVAALFFAILARNSGFFLNAGVILLIVTVALCLSVVLPVMIINMVAQRRRKKIESQFPISLDIFVRALRSGHPIASALDLLTNEMEDPIGSEYGLVADEVSYGAELTDALQGMAARWDLEDMRMFVVSISVQRETGGNLAEILENLSDVIRARASMYLKVRALSSEGRMTGVMLTVLPIFALVSMFLVNPGFYLDVASDPIFLIGFPALFLLYLIGFFWIRKMVDLKV